MATPMKRRASLAPTTVGGSRAGVQTGQRPVNRPYIPTDLVHPDDVYWQRPHTSIRTYTTEQGQQVIERGNQRIIVHQQPPPKRRMHPVIVLGSGMLAAALLFLALNAGYNWWQSHQLDASYGYPRTFQ